MITSTIPGALAHKLSNDATRDFVKCGGDWLSTSDVERSSRRIAAGLVELGLEKGDRVAVLLPNRQECIELFFACARLGLVQVLINQFLKGEFLQYQLTDSGAKVLVTDTPGVESVRSLVIAAIERVVTVDDAAIESRELSWVAWSTMQKADDVVLEVDVKPNDAALIVYTSGTTGRPKGCVLNHGYVTHTPAPFQELELIQPNDRFFTSFGFGHLSGPITLMFALMIEGGSVCFEPTFSASTYLDRATEECASVTYGVGTMPAALLAQLPKSNDSQHSLRLALWFPLSADLQAAWEARFKIPVVCEGIGQSECATIALGKTSKKGSLGHPVSFLDLRVFDDDGNEAGDNEVGELVLRPREPNVMFSGYWSNPEATLSTWRDLWHHTGDLARRDEDGCLHFVDRKSDSMRRRGENVSSFELESAILGFADVAAVAVCAVPSPLGGDDIKACIVLKAGREPHLDVLFEYFKTSLPYFAVPRYVEFRDSLPLTPATARVQKHILRAEGVTERTYDLQEMGFTIGQADRRGSTSLDGDEGS